MKCSVKSSRSERIFEISGEFSAADEDLFFDVFRTVQSMTEPALAFDLGKCSKIDPSAMGMLLIACEEAGKRRIKRCIRNAPQKIKEQLLIAKFDDIYDFQ